VAGAIERSRKAKDLELLFQIISGPILISSVWAPFVLWTRQGTTAWRSKASIGPTVPINRDYPDGQGVDCNAESEVSRRQSDGLMNRNRIRGCPC